MNETLVTLQGWLGSEVTTRQAGDSPVASFRIACTPRRYQKKTDEWVNGDTQWFTVNAWRGLAENCARSLRRGDPVVVHGRLNAQVWTNSAGIDVSSFDIEASFVGHDLNRGTSEFVRNVRAPGEEAQSVVESVAQSVAQSVAEAVVESGGEVPASAPAA